MVNPSFVDSYRMFMKFYVFRANFGVDCEYVKIFEEKVIFIDFFKLFNLIKHAISTLKATKDKSLCHWDLSLGGP